MWIEVDAPIDAHCLTGQSFAVLCKRVESHCQAGLYKTCWCRPGDCRQIPPLCHQRCGNVFATGVCLGRFVNTCKKATLNVVSVHVPMGDCVCLVHQQGGQGSGTAVL